MSSIIQRGIVRSAMTVRPTHLVAPMICTRSLSLATDIRKKEKVEEDRYIRQKEHEAYMARKEKVLKEQGKRELSALEASHKKEHDDAVKEVFGVLSLTGEKLTDEAVENFASW